MRAADIATSDTDRRHNDSIRCQVLQQHADGQHIHNRVHLSQLMEMDLLDTCAVHSALGLGNTLIYGKSLFPHSSADRHGIQNFLNPGQIPMCVLLRFRLPFFFAVYPYMKL